MLKLGEVWVLNAHKLNQENFKITNMGLLRVALVLAIVYLAANDKDGWGWLVFILLISMDYE